MNFYTKDYDDLLICELDDDLAKTQKIEPVETNPVVLGREWLLGWS